MQSYIDTLIQNIGILQPVPPLIIYAAAILLGCAVVFGYISVVAMIMIYAERKVAGHMQSRYGPMRVGPHGILQSIADSIKLLLKEDIVPDKANRFLFKLAPLLVFAGAFVPFAVLPFSEHLVISRMNIGIFYVLSFAAIEVIGVIMAGWASGSKWSLYGGMRLAAQMVSYEIPMGLAVLTVVACAGQMAVGMVCQSTQESVHGGGLCCVLYRRAGFNQAFAL